MTQQDQPQQPDVGMLLAQIEETNLLLSIARNRCATLRRENNELRAAIGRESTTPREKE